MKKKTHEFILQRLIQCIYSSEIQNIFKMNESDFTRDRKLNFTRILLFIINRITKTLAIEIDNIVRVFIKNRAIPPESSFTKSAFVQSRKKINPEVFIYLSNNLIQEFYTDNIFKRWHGYRLLAVDGSILTLPNTKALKKEFGSDQNHLKDPIVQGRISVLYDVINGFVIDSVLAPMSRSERKLAVNHLEYSQNGDLVIYDRGYPSFDMIFEHSKRNIDFLFRTKISFSKQTKAFADSDLKTQLIRLRPREKTDFSVKDYTINDYVEIILNKVILPDGTVEILLSSLVDTKKYRNNIFKDLYFKRWKVETFYDELKNKLQVGNFSGYSPQVIFQDFYSTIFVSNIQTLLIDEVKEEIKEEYGSRKYEYKVNTNVSYGILKNRIIEIFFTEQPLSKTISDIKELLKKHVVPIRPNRKHKRDIRKFKYRTMPKVTKNQKDAL